MLKRSLRKYDKDKEKKNGNKKIKLEAQFDRFSICKKRIMSVEGRAMTTKGSYLSVIFFLNIRSKPVFIHLRGSKSAPKIKLKRPTIRQFVSYPLLCNTWLRHVITKK